MKKDDLDYVIEALQKRDEILINDKSVNQYNKYFDKMCKYARKLIDNDRQNQQEADSIYLKSTRSQM